MPELRVGLPLPPEGIEILRSVAAPQYLQRVVTTGVTFLGQVAVEAGLADESVPRDQVLNRARAIARDLTAIPPQVFSLSKLQLRKPIVERICRHATRFMDEVNRLWRDPQVRAAVAEYVRSRL
jgi:enoyl-CoA hydratase